MRMFEDRFLTIGLPYRVIGGPRFYERMEIRDAMAYLRIVISSEDDLAFVHFKYAQARIRIKLSKKFNLRQDSTQLL